MRGYEQILGLFGAWDERDDAIPFGELVASLNDLELERADLAGALVFADRNYRRVAIRRRPHYEALSSAGRAASGARFTTIWVHRASSGWWRCRAPETRYVFSPCGKLVPERSRTFAAGSVAACRDEAIHQMANLEPPGQDLITLHVYSPPPSAWNYFTLDRTTLADHDALLHEGPRRSSLTSARSSRAAMKRQRSMQRAERRGPSDRRRGRRVQRDDGRGASGTARRGDAGPRDSIREIQRARARRGVWHSVRPAFAQCAGGLDERPLPDEPGAFPRLAACPRRQGPPRHVRPATGLRRLSRGGFGVQRTQFDGANRDRAGRSGRRRGKRPLRPRSIDDSTGRPILGGESGARARRRAARGSGGPGTARLGQWLHCRSLVARCARAARADDAIVLIGTGLTAVDLIVEAEACGHRGTIVAISRHGLLPCRHQSSPAFRPHISIGSGTTVTARSLLRGSGRWWRSA